MNKLICDSQENRALYAEFCHHRRIEAEETKVCRLSIAVETLPTLCASNLEGVG
jgi:hypothetical protein